MPSDALPLVSLPAPLISAPEQLTRDATHDELTQAAALNHIDWFTAEAVASGGEVRVQNGLIFIRSAPDTTRSSMAEVILAFPRMDAATAGEMLDEAIHEARRLNARQVSCWSLLPAEPSDLGVRLVARGFQWGWQPHWMALDTERATLDVDFPLPDELHITLDDASDWDVEGLPYYDRADVPRFQAHAKRLPRHTYHFGAWLGGKLVGHSLIHISTGPLGVAGMYSVSVLPEARGKGVGRAVSLAACQYAKALGCRYVLLNAATHIYERLGFVSLGLGQTWWMHRPALEAPPPAPDEVAFLEAVGRGDINALEAMGVVLDDLDATLPCKMTPLGAAARFQQPQAAEWLLEHGATPDIMPLYDLGWHERIPGVLAARPEIVNRCLGEWGATALHEAILRNNVELIRLLLAANPDLSIEDAQFHSTPLGWARHIGRDEIIHLINTKMERST